MNMLTLIAASWLSATEPPQSPVAEAYAPILLAQAERPPRRDDRGPPGEDREPPGGRRHHGEGGRRPPPPRDPEELAQELGLDSSQSHQFVTVLSEQRAKHEALREQQRNEREAARSAHQQIEEETFVRLSAFMSTEQLARFHARRPPPPPPPPPPRNDHGPGERS